MNLYPDISCSARALALGLWPVILAVVVAVGYRHGAAAAFSLLLVLGIMMWMVCPRVE